MKTEQTGPTLHWRHLPQKTMTCGIANLLLTAARLFSAFFGCIYPALSSTLLLPLSDFCATAGPGLSANPHNY